MAAVANSDVNDRGEHKSHSTTEHNLPQPTHSENGALVTNQTKGRAAATVDFQQQGILPSVSLSPEAINVDAQLVSKSINQKNWMFQSNPDLASINRILEPMSAVDRRNLEDAYKRQNGHSLRDDMHGKLGAVDFKKEETILNRSAGKTNLSGNVDVALETMKTDPEKGQKLLRATLETSNAKQLSDLDAQYKKEHNGKGYLQAINDDPNITQENKNVLNLMAFGAKPNAVGPNAEGIELNGKKYAASGTDHRTADDIKAMAEQAVNAHDLRMFSDAVGGDLPAAQAARKQLGQDANFTGRFQGAFENGKSDSDKQIAEDLRTEGRVSLASIVTGNSNVLGGLLDNPKNTDLALVNATEKERSDFTLGRQLTDQGKAASTPAEQDAVKYYQKMEAAFTQALKPGSLAAGQISETLATVPGAKEAFEKDDARRRSVWEDELQHGRKTLVSDLTDAYQGSYTKTDALLTKAENMNQADWSMIHGSKPALDQFKKELGQSLQTYATPDQQKRILDLVDAKAQAKTFPDSQQVKRSVEELIEDNKSSRFGNSYDTAKITSGIASMSAEDAHKYQNNTGGLRDKLDNFVKENLTGPGRESELLLAQSALKQAGVTGKSPELTPVQTLLKDRVDNVDDATRARDLDKVLQDTHLVDRLKEVEKVRAQGGSALGQRLSNDPAFKESFDLSNTLRESGPAGVGNQNAWNQTLDSGRVPPGIKYSAGVPVSELYEDFAKMPKAQRDNLSISDEDKKILNNVVAQNGKEDLSDRMRAYNIGDGGDYRDFQSQLSKLSPNEKEQLKSEYQKKYGGSLDDDFLKKVDNADQIQYKNLLSPSSRDGMQDFIDRVNQVDGSGHPLDATGWTTERATQLNESLLQKYSAIKEKLPEDKQRMLDQFYSDAKRQAGDSEEALAEAAYKTTVAAAMIATIPLSGGLSAAALGAVVAGSAAYRVGLLKSIEGGDFDDSLKNIVKQSAIGAVDGALIATPAVLKEVGVFAKLVKEGRTGADAISELRVGTEGAEAADTGVVARDVQAGRDLQTARDAAVVPATVVAATTEVGATVLESPTKPDKPIQPVAPPVMPNDLLIKLATVRPGEGPWQSAERILKADGQKHSIDELRDLAHGIKQVYKSNPNNVDISGLPINHRFINRANFNQLVNQVKDARVHALLMQFAAH